MTGETAIRAHSQGLECLVLDGETVTVPSWDIPGFQKFSELPSPQIHQDSLSLDPITFLRLIPINKVLEQLVQSMA